MKPEHKSYFILKKLKDEKITFSIVIAGGVVLFVWMFFQYLKSNYDDYRLERHIQSFEQRNEQITEKISNQMRDYSYFTSDAYLEKYAKGSLGMRLPGEKMIVLKEKEEIEERFKVERAGALEFENMENPDKWYLYFFGDRSKAGI